MGVLTKFKSAAATTFCKKGTCASATAQTSTVTTDQTQCCMVNTQCSDVFTQTNQATSCGTGPIAVGSSTNFDGTRAAGAAANGYLPVSAGAPTDWIALSSKSASITSAARNRCCTSG